MSLLQEAMDRKVHWLYLIDSGNDDLIYKIGYTGRSLQERLDEIKLNYCVPKAKIISQLQILGQSKALQLEQRLHKLCEDCHEYTYAGQEFFELSPDLLKQVQTYYT